MTLTKYNAHPQRKPSYVNIYLRREDMAGQSITCKMLLITYTTRPDHPSPYTYVKYPTGKAIYATGALMVVQPSVYIGIVHAPP